MNIVLPQIIDILFFGAGRINYKTKYKRTGASIIARGATP